MDHNQELRRDRKGSSLHNIEGSYKLGYQKGTNQDLEPAYFSLPAIFRNKFLERISYRSDKEVNHVHVFQKLLNQEKADNQTGTNSTSKYVTTRIPRYRGKASTTSCSNGAEPTGRDTSNVGQSGSVYLRSTKNGPQDVLDNHDVHSQFHPMARRDFYSDRNVQKSSAEDVQPDNEASMNSLQEAQDMHVYYGECHYVETEWGWNDKRHSLQKTYQNVRTRGTKTFRCTA